MKTKNKNKKMFYREINKFKDFKNQLNASKIENESKNLKD